MNNLLKSLKLLKKMPSRETADLLFYLRVKDWKKIKYLSKNFFTNQYDRRIIWKDTIAVRFWKKIPHTHKIFKFEEEGYCFCTRCYRDWSLEDWKIEERDRKLIQIFKK